MKGCALCSLFGLGTAIAAAIDGTAVTLSLACFGLMITAGAIFYGTAHLSREKKTESK